jgi:precorrin-2 dehydrogenase/sirohydrochlorin ferrochelatase
MKCYPACLRVEGRPCLVVGGGEVGSRKALALRDAGARVTVIAEEVAPVLEDKVRAGLIEHRRRRYQEGDVRGFFLVFAATSDGAVQRQIFDEAYHAGILVNVADRPDLCTFIAPSVAARGDLVVAVSSSGTSPAFARRVRREIERSLGPEYGLALRILGRLRHALRSSGVPAARRRTALVLLADSDLVEHLRDGDLAAADRLIAQHAGPAFSLRSLGISGMLGAAGAPTFER